MSNPRATIRQAELTRYAKALQAAGVTEWRVEIDPTGKVAIIAGKGSGDNKANPWDAE